MKKIGIRFWSVFEKDYETKAISPKNINKASFKEMASGNDVVFYVEPSGGPHYMGEEIGEHEAPFQEMIMKKLVEQQLDKSGIPYNSVELDKPGDIEIDVNYDVANHKDWEKAITAAIKEEGNE